MSLKYTPGPWKYKLSLETFTIFCEKVGRAICRKVINENDARLIAAAPEMLELLIKRYVDLIKAIPLFEDHNREECMIIIDEYKQIIEKATGMTIEEVLNVTD